jgi:heterodisulfide reductase subunit A-like polyferredoxin
VTQHPRIGIFLCECAGEIADRIDLGNLAGRAKSYPYVVHVDTRPFWCSGDGLDSLKSLADKEQLDRVVVAGCSPRTHGTLLRSLVEEAGLNWNFCQIVNLREQCARVHPDAKAQATEKADRLLRMGVAAAANAEVVELTETKITPVAAVIGGGIAGMTAALSLARRGIDVQLVEQESHLGGTLRELKNLYPGHVDTEAFLATRIKAIEESKKIDVLLGSEMTSLRGHPGAFEVMMKRAGKEETIPAGAVVFATGADEWTPPAGREDGRVVSLTRLHALMKKGELSADAMALVISPEGPLSREPSSVSLIAHSVLECAEQIREGKPQISITILFQDLPVTAKKTAQELFRSGIPFVRYGSENPPKVTDRGLEVRDHGTGENVTVDADLTVMAAGLSPSKGTHDLGKLAILWQDANGFLVEPFLRLRPEEVFDRGIYVAGTAHGPADVVTSMSQAFGAAARAHSFIEAGKIVKRALVAVVDEEICRGCGQCEDVCPFGAAVLVNREGGKIRTSVIDDVLCTGCGFCVSECISGAIRLPYLTDRQVRRMVAEAGK